MHSSAVLPDSKRSNTLTTFVSHLFIALFSSVFWDPISHLLNSLSNSHLSVHTSASSCRGTARSVFGENASEHPRSFLMGHHTLCQQVFGRCVNGRARNRKCPTGSACTRFMIS